MLSKTLLAKWQAAQIAERDYWFSFGVDDPVDSQRRQILISSETQKADFIFNEMLAHFGIDAAKDWSKLSILDVGCGPTSLVARSKLGKTRVGVDPLKYPDWVYDSYKTNNFKVYLQPFEEFQTTKKYDIIIFYNALQHFADLKSVAQKCYQHLARSGAVYLSEYLEVPTNEAHIQFLEAPKLDRLFKAAGFKVQSVKKLVRLPGLVERPNGQPIELYIARLKC